VIPNLVAVTYSAGSVSKASGSLTIDWASSNALGSDSLQLTFTSEADGGGEVALANAQQTLGTSGNYTLSASDLSVFQPGVYTTQVCRTRSLTVNAPAAGGDLFTTACTATYPITITN
jgi:hypothetical protein